MTVSIRPARPEDIPALRAVERDAGQRFGAVGLAAIADNEPTSEAFMAAVLAHGIAFSAVDADEAPVGFLLAGKLDHGLHIYEISVATQFGGRGIGSQLLLAIEQAARKQSIPAMTLATFRDVPWNRPFYERRGFVEVPWENWTPAFHLLHAGEQLSKLPLDRRLFMRKELR
jgi:ribosomal protein S18 acetylase RimI-like enzyme